MGGIDLDPCADPLRRVPASNHFTKEQNVGSTVGWKALVQSGIQPISYLGEAAWPLLPYRRRKPIDGAAPHET